MALILSGRFILEARAVETCFFITWLTGNNFVLHFTYGNRGITWHLLFLVVILGSRLQSEQAINLVPMCTCTIKLFLANRVRTHAAKRVWTSQLPRVLWLKFPRGWYSKLHKDGCKVSSFDPSPQKRLGLAVAERAFQRERYFYCQVETLCCTLVAQTAASPKFSLSLVVPNSAAVFKSAMPSSMCKIPSTRHATLRSWQYFIAAIFKTHPWPLPRGKIDGLILELFWVHCIICLFQEEKQRFLLVKVAHCYRRRHCRAFLFPIPFYRRVFLFTWTFLQKNIVNECRRSQPELVFWAAEHFVLHQRGCAASRYFVTITAGPRKAARTAVVRGLSSLYEHSMLQGKLNRRSIPTWSR